MISSYLVLKEAERQAVIRENSIKKQLSKLSSQRNKQEESDSNYESELFSSSEE
jgi:hypothetical protein